MAIQSSSATFTRFFLEDPVKKNFWDHIDKGLKAGRFQDVPENQSISVGFASWDDLFDTGFEYSAYHKGEYVAFNFRVDQRKIPPVLMKHQLRLAVDDFREKNDDKWPSRQEKDQLREEVAMRLLRKALPQPAGYEIVWNTEKKWLLVGTTSKRVINAFWEHLENHLQAYPVPLYHFQWALRLLPAQGRERNTLASLIALDSSEALFDGMFLGYEFLTWLWFFSENTSGRIRLPDYRQAFVQLGERLVLSRTDDGSERIVCTTQTNNLHEARTALQQGKMVEEVQIYMKMGDNEYFAVLDTKLWAIKSLKTPKQLTDRDEAEADGRFLEKMYFIEEVLGCLDTVYSRFLSERLSPKWDAATWPQIKKWCKKK